MNASKLDIWVGLFVLIGGLALVFLALKVGNLLSGSLADSYSVNAQFLNIGGLKPNAPVKSAGVVIGRVSAIQFDNQTFKANVIMAISDKVKIPTDSSAKILTSGLLGEQYIGIDAGAEEENLKTNARITRTQSAVVLEELIGQFLNRMTQSGS